MGGRRSDCPPTPFHRRTVPDYNLMRYRHHASRVPPPERCNTTLAANDLAKAREYADRCMPLLAEFQLSSPTLLVLRDLGYCYKVLGNVQSRTAGDRSLYTIDRRGAASSFARVVLKRVAVWREWNRRGAATAESEAERHRVERLLQN